MKSKLLLCLVALSAGSAYAETIECREKVTTKNGLNRVFINNNSGNKSIRFEEEGPNGHLSPTLLSYGPVGVSDQYTQSNLMGALSSRRSKSKPVHVRVFSGKYAPNFGKHISTLMEVRLSGKPESVIMNNRITGKYGRWYAFPSMVYMETRSAYDEKGQIRTDSAGRLVYSTRKDFVPMYCRWASK